MGANPATVAAWIAETDAEKAAYELSAYPVTSTRRMDEAEVEAIVDWFADLARMPNVAAPED